MRTQATIVALWTSRPATRSCIVSIVSSSTNAPPAWGALCQGKLRSVLQGIAALGASEGHQGTPGPTRNRALAHQRETDHLADGCTIISHRHSVSSTRVGRQVGTELAMTTKFDPSSAQNKRRFQGKRLSHLNREARGAAPRQPLTANSTCR